MLSLAQEYALAKAEAYKKMAALGNRYSRLKGIRIAREVVKSHGLIESFYPLMLAEFERSLR